MFEFQRTIEAVITVVPPMLIASFGGFIAVLNSKTKNRSLPYFLSGISTSAFVGLVVHWIMRHLAVSQDLSSAIICISGFASSDVLDILKEKVLAKFRSGSI